MSGVSGGRMRCHYEVLQVDRDVSDADLRKAYRKMALKYHPDKNPDNVEECTKLFNAIQQAYEVLSDPQERAWYDKHREEILHGAGSDFKDDSLNIMPFFSTSCFSGFGDDSRGFYKVYGAVFCRIADEEEEYMEEDGERLPGFGLSTTPYEEVHTFYAYWQSFSTLRSFAWEDVHDLRQAPNRKVQRLMEKENKKERSAAKKKRNEAVRQLVSFVRKRDKRVQQYRESLEEKERERKKRAEEKQTRDKQRRLRERQEARERYQAQKWEESLEQDLLSVEARLDAEYGREGGEEERDGGYEEGETFCPACNKLFKSDKAFANHEGSKKHRENVALLKCLLEEEEREMRDSSQQTTTTSDKQQSTTTDTQQTNDKQQTMATTATDKQQATITADKQQTMTSSMEESRQQTKEVRAEENPLSNDEGEVEEVERAEDKEGDEKGKKEEEGEEVDGVTEELQNQQLSDSDSDPDLTTASSIRILGEDGVKQEHDNLPTAEDTPTSVGERARLDDSSDDDGWFSSSKSKRKTRRKGKAKEAVNTSAKSQTTQIQPESLKCSVCSIVFKSRNKLFRHIETTGHAISLPSSSSSPSSTQSQHKAMRKNKTHKK